MINEQIRMKIENLLNNSKIIVFMKWERQMPMCGFSANVVWILEEYWVDFDTYNILSDMEIREWLKDYSSWPTYPQVYVDWEIIWWSDIITELHEEWELWKILWIK